MKRASLLLILFAAAGTANAAVLLTSIKVTETGSEKGPNASLCAGFSLSPKKVARFFSKAVPVTGYELHDNYIWGPCFVRGTATVAGHTSAWEIRVGGTGQYSAPDGSIQMVADPGQRYHQE